MRRAVAAALAAALAGALLAGPAAAAPPAAAPPAAARPAGAPAAAAPVALAAEVPRQAFGTHGTGQAGRHALAGSVRLGDCEWGRVEPAQGRFRWADCDAAVAAARAQGARDVLLVVGSTPGWAADTPAGRDHLPSDPPASVSDWERWVSAAARHFRGTGVAYELWNEGNLRTFYTGSTALAVTLTVRASRAIRRIDPTATVVAFSTTMRTPGSYRAFYPAYLRGLAAAGWPVDALAVHSYPDASGTPATRRDLVRTFLAAVRAAGAPSRVQLWDTEVNYGLAGPGPAYPHRTLTGAVAAGWVARSYLDSLRLGLDRTYWYAQARHDPVLGIQMWAGTAGLAGQRAVASWLAGAVWRGCRGGGAAVVCTVVRPGAAVVDTVVWAESGQVRVAVPAGARQACTALGACTAVRPGQRVAVAGLPVRFGA